MTKIGTLLILAMTAAACRSAPSVARNQPHSRGYDLAATRVEDGQLVVRLVDSQSVFYPGQGAVGSSHTSWFVWRCVVIDALVHCSEPVSIASRSCTTEQASEGSGSPLYKKTCTGGPPGA
jgi:hypothetical protein